MRTIFRNYKAALQNKNKVIQRSNKNNKKRSLIFNHNQNPTSLKYKNKEIMINFTSIIWLDLKQMKSIKSFYNLIKQVNTYLL